MKRLIAVLAAVLMAAALPADAAKQKNKSGSSPSSVLKGKKGHVVGLVVAASGHHAGHARLTIQKVGSRSKSHPKVNAAGHFSAKLKPGTYRIAASHRSYGSGRVTTAIAGGSNTSVTVHLSGKAKHKARHHRHLRIRHHLHHKKLKSPGSTASTGSSSSTTTGGAAAPSQIRPAK